VDEIVNANINESISLEKAKQSSIFKSKSNILLTALHHSREPLSLSMLVYLTIDYLWKCNQSEFLNEQGSFTKFFNFGNVILVPAVNRDSYEFINNSLNSPHWEIKSNKRKNMNSTIPCLPHFFNDPQNELTSQISSGVDINRNYSSRDWGKDSGSSGDPCKDGYRGNK
jgi:hypothetical protein